MRFLIPQYLAYKNGDGSIELFLLIMAFKLAGSFGLIFEPFGEVFQEDLKPGGTIPLTQNVLEFQEMLNISFNI